jgi:hypothetical protein
MGLFAASDGRGGLWRSRWAAIGAAVAVTFGAGGLFAANAASPESSTVAIEPVRILDTRTDVGLPGPFVSATAQDLKVTGSIPTATGTQTVVPAGATGVYLNVTPVSSTAGGFISVRPANAAGLPTTSNVNFTTGAINPNAVLVELPVGGGDDGKIEITFDAFGAAGPTTEVLVDVVGYTTDTRLKAIETALATKANSADVYTRTQIDASAANSTKAAGYVGSDGLSGCANFACIGTWTSSTSGPGRYTISVPGAAVGCLKFPIVQLTTIFEVGSTAVSGSTGVACGSGNTNFTVNTYNAAGALANSAFYFTIQVQPGSPLNPGALVDSLYDTCTIDETGTKTCQ